jgi:predicted AlkP superfamily pyrophosphatase or phosphodiesterase
MRIAPAVFLALLIPGFAPAPEAAAAPRAEHVFIFSFDQGAPRVIQKSEMPAFKAMAAEGAHTWEAFTIVPSITLPSHVSMLTGLGIQKHQVLWNDFLPEKGLVKVPTIFSLAKSHGFTTAMYVGKIKFKHLQLPGSLDAFAVAGEAEKVAAAFAADVAKLKPNLCFLHFEDPDLAGHQYGLESPEQFKAFADSDRALETVREAVKAAGLLDSSVFILTADHGGHNRTPQEIEARVKQGLAPQPGTHGLPDSSDVLIPWVAWGKDVKKGFQVQAPVVTYDTAATALWLLGVPVPEGFWGRPVTSAFE